MTAAPQSLEDIQDALLDRFHAGERIDRDALLAEHPEHATALARFLRVMDVLEEPAPPADDAPRGRLGDYEIIEEVGRGGMGVVYAAQQLSLKRPVALKILPPALRFDRQLLKRFQREAEAAGRLRHPNIVPVYTTGEVGGAPFFAMELVAGESLAQHITAWKRDGAAAGSDDEAARVRWCVELMARVLDALDYAHGEGIIHRDVKPANILVEADGTPRLTDFGLALDVDASELTVAGEVFGSPLYMSPEQARHASTRLDARSDIYSVAVTLYELLTLRLPYEGDSRATQLGALAEGRIVPPRSVTPSLPAALDAVLVRALQVDPAARFASAAACARALRAALAGQVDDKLLAATPPAAGLWAGSGAGSAMGAVAATDGATGAVSGATHAAPAAGADAAASATGRRRRSSTGLLVALVLTAVVFVALGSLGLLYLWLMPARGVETAEPPAPQASGEGPPARAGNADGAAAPASETDAWPELTAAELGLLADGRHPDGAAALERWLSAVRLELRDVVSRAEDGDCRFVWPHKGPTLGAGHWLGARIQASVDGGPWVGDGFQGLHFSPPEGDTLLGFIGSAFASASGAGSTRFDHGVHALLGEALERDEVVLRLRLTLRVQSLDTPATGEAFHGTEGHWTASRRLRIVDAYPDDYPTPVTWREHAQDMRAGLTPRHAKFEERDGEARVVLELPDPPGGPVPGAFDVALYEARPGGGLLLGRATLVAPARSPWVVPSHVHELEVVRAGDASEVVLGAWRELAAGRIGRLHLRYTPSVELAREEPTFDEYWAEPVEVEVLLGG